MNLNTNGKIIKITDYTIPLFNEIINNTIKYFNILKHLKFLNSDNNDEIKNISNMFTELLKNELLKNKDKDISYYGIIRNCNVKNFDNKLISCSEKIQISEKIYYIVVEGPDDLFAVRSDAFENVDKNVWDILKNNL